MNVGTQHFKASEIQLTALGCAVEVRWLMVGQAFAEPLLKRQELPDGITNAQPSPD
jgi:hypothetical protein